MKQFKPSYLKQYMKIVHRNGNEMTARELDYSTIYDGCLNHRSSYRYLDIMEVYEPTLDGWNLLWKREEELFTLQCPMTKYYLYKNQLNEWEWELIGEKLTQKEIDNLPNQDLIKSLIKNKV